MFEREPSENEYAKILIFAKVIYNRRKKVKPTPHYVT